MTKPNRPLADVSRETQERLEIYVDLVRRWNERINLVSRTSLKDIWKRHVADSQQLVQLGRTSGSWLDLGSGGGFPGMVAAICRRGSTPDDQTTLVESDQRKCAFLRVVAHETGTRCNILNLRIEALQNQRAQTVSARALANLDTLLEYAHQHLAPDGKAIFPKGRNWKSELESARQRWSFDYDPVTSQTDPDAVILCIKGVSRV